MLFLDSQGLGNVPGLRKVIDYLPDQAGAVITHLSGAGAGQFGRPYGPWTGMAIMLGWTVAALVSGYLVLSRTDVSSSDRPGRGRWIATYHPLPRAVPAGGRSGRTGTRRRW
jgi:hypothetical protein